MQGRRSALLTGQIPLNTTVQNHPLPALIFRNSSVHRSLSPKPSACGWLLSRDGEGHLSTFKSLLPDGEAKPSHSYLLGEFHFKSYREVPHLISLWIPVHSCPISRYKDRFFWLPSWHLRAKLKSALYHVTHRNDIRWQGWARCPLEPHCICPIDKWKLLISTLEKSFWVTAAACLANYSAMAVGDALRGGKHKSGCFL